MTTAKAEMETPAATAPQPQGQPPQQAPAPTHEDAVAALRYFHAISHELEGLLKDSGLGRKDMKGEIIDAMTRLVAAGIVGTSEAVPTLGTVPSDPIQQRKWLQDHFNSAMVAENAVLEHHRAAHPGGRTYAEDVAMHPHSHSDRHMNAIKSLMGHYHRGAG